MQGIPYFTAYALLTALWIWTDPRSRKLLLDQSQTTTRMILILVPQFVSGLWFPWPATRYDGFIGALGAIIFWLGFALAIWAKIVMKHNWGSPAQHTIARQNTLITSGPFRFTRNPIYLGLMCMALGVSLALHSIFAPLVVAFVLHILRIVATEEKLLVRHFGGQYQAYMKRVPRFF